MSKVAIIYGTSTGTTEAIALKVKKILTAADIFDVARLSLEQIKPYDFYILGTSTTGFGDLQNDWDEFLPQFSSLDFTGKKIALFGLGDSSSYSDTFANGMSQLYKELKDKAEIVGSVSTEGYEYENTESTANGKFVGLVIDEENESDKTDNRLNAWIEDLKKYL